MSPRTRLQNDKNLADRVQSMVDSEVFDMAADAALLQYMESLNIPLTTEQYAFNYAKLAGAKDFLKVFKRIADISTPKQQTGLPPNLDFKA